MTDRIEFEAVARDHMEDSGLVVIDNDGNSTANWVALHKSKHDLKLGARYRVTIERARAKLPEGATWVGDTIRHNRAGLIHVYSVDSNVSRVVIRVEGAYAEVPSWAFDAFRAEGLL